MIGRTNNDIVAMTHLERHYDKVSTQTGKELLAKGRGMKMGI